MSDDNRIISVLKKKGIVPGDSVEVCAPDGRIVQGILMPHQEDSDEDIIIIKISSGYNIGIRLDDPNSVKALENERKKLPEKGKSQPSKAQLTQKDSTRKRISIVSTGGTIASYVDYRTGAVHPAVSADELVASVPHLREICDLETEMLYSILSENMKPENWKNLAERVADHMNRGSTGVIVPHGTDTMGFSAAALSFALSNLTGPVVLVGSQRSSDRPSSDATINLLSAARVCTDSDLGEVAVLMHETTDDIRCILHRGTRVRKLHSSRRDAFQSVNELPLGYVEKDRVTLHGEYDKRAIGKVQADAKFSTDVVLVQFYPGLTASRLEDFVDNANGIVIAGTGLGHVSQEITPLIEKLTKDGVPVCITTQTIWGSTNLNVYSTGRDMLAAGAIPLGDMLTETAYVKLSWILGHTNEMDKVRELMQSNLRHEISERRAL